MTDDDKKFVREQRKGAIALIQLASTTTTKPTSLLYSLIVNAHAKLRLLTLLIQEAAMREKAEYRLEQIAHSSAYNKPQRDWSDSNWIRAIKERWEI